MNPKLLFLLGLDIYFLVKCKCHVQFNLSLRKTWSYLFISSNIRLSFSATHLLSTNPIVSGLNEARTSDLLSCGTADGVCGLYPLSNYYSQGY